MAESPIPIAEIDHGPSKLDQFLDKHTTKLIIGAIIVALAVIGYVIYSGLEQAKDEEAGSALTSADTAEKYQEVIKTWPESKSAESAQMLLASAQWEDTKEDSLDTLRKFIVDSPEHPAISTAKVSLGLKLLQLGKTDEAQTLLTEVANDDQASYISPLASISLGDIAKSNGKTEEAITWYEKAKEDPTGQGNTFGEAAEVRLALAKAAPPTKVAPAPPAPPTPPAPTAPSIPSGTPTFPSGTPTPIPTPTSPSPKLPELPEPSSPEKPDEVSADKKTPPSTEDTEPRL